MQYLVSIENTTYFYWQIELLIESFKMKGLEDKLVIAIAENDSTKDSQYTKNISKHENQFMHANVGQQSNFLPLNKIFATITALEEGRVQQPFALIHPDMVLFKELEARSENIAFNVDPRTIAVIAKLQPHLNQLAKNNNIENIPNNLFLGGVLQFNDVDIAFYQRVYNWMRWFAQQQQNQNESWDIAKGAWILSAYEYLGQHTYLGLLLEGQLFHNIECPNFVHYSDGLMPIFSKNYYKNIDVRLHEDPYAALLKYIPSEAAEVLHNVVKSYQA
jgi:hypothetical protein